MRRIRNPEPWIAASHGQNLVKTARASSIYFCQDKMSGKKRAADAIAGELPPNKKQTVTVTTVKWWIAEDKKIFQYCNNLAEVG